MIKIKVICGGCGIEHRDENGNMRYMLKTSEDGPFDCEEETAVRLVSLGVAEYAERTWIPAREGKFADRLPVVSEELLESTDHEEAILQEGEIEEKQLRMMKIRELERVARNMGLNTGKCAKKEDYVKLIMEAEQEEEKNEEAEDEEMDEPPFLKAEVPV